MSAEDHFKLNKGKKMFNEFKKSKLIFEKAILSFKRCNILTRMCFARSVNVQNVLLLLSESFKLTIRIFCVN